MKESTFTGKMITCEEGVYFYNEAKMGKTSELFCLYRGKMAIDMMVINMMGSIFTGNLVIARHFEIVYTFTGKMVLDMMKDSTFMMKER